MSNILSYGKKGEDITVEFLKKKGYIIFKRNYHSRYGEIDIIAEKGNVLAFVEVKTRGTNAVSLPCEAVDFNKQRRIKLTAADFLRKNVTEYRCRFDVSEITVISEKDGKFNCKLNYITDAFT